MLGGLFNKTAPPPPPKSATQIEYENMLAMKQRASLMNSATFGSGGAYTLGPTDSPVTKYKITSILIEETSNGHIIRIGSVVRICPLDATLFDEVAAAYTEAKL